MFGSEFVRSKKAAAYQEGNAIEKLVRKPTKTKSNLLIGSDVK
jgi:hypothetical protein